MMVIMLIFLLGVLGTWCILRARRTLALACWLTMIGLMLVSMAYHMTDSLNISL